MRRAVWKAWRRQHHGLVGHVQMTGGCQPSSLVEQGLPCRIGQMVDTTDGMRDPHIVIIDDNRQVVGRGAIAAQNYQVVEIGSSGRRCVLEPGRSMHSIAGASGALKRICGRNSGRGIFDITIAPSPIIERRTPVCAGLLAHTGQLFRRTIAMIGQPLGQQILGNLPVSLGARAN